MFAYQLYSCTPFIRGSEQNPGCKSQEGYIEELSRFSPSANYAMINPKKITKNIKNQLCFKSYSRRLMIYNNTSEEIWTLVTCLTLLLPVIFQCMTAKTWADIYWAIFFICSIYKWIFLTLIQHKSYYETVNNSTVSLRINLLVNKYIILKIACNNN